MASPALPRLIDRGVGAILIPSYPQYPRQVTERNAAKHPKIKAFLARFVITLVKFETK